MLAYLTELLIDVKTGHVLCQKAVETPLIL